MLRGIGALLVVAIHVNNWLYAREMHIGISHIAYFANWHQFGAVGVDIFFVISGFVIALTMGRYAGRSGTFLVQRFLRIAPLAYLMSGLWMLRLHYLGQPVAMPGIISTIVLAPVLPQYTVPTLDVLWTLSFEFTLYLIVFGLLLAGKGVRFLLAFLCLGAAIGLVHVFDYPLLRFATHPMLFEFALGIVAYMLWKARILPRWLVLTSGALGALLLVGEALIGTGIPANPALAISGESALRRVLLWAVPTFLLLNFLLTWQPRPNALTRLLMLVGDSSYSIYLIHLFVISYLVGRLPLPPDGRWIILFIAANLAGILLYLAVEKPMSRLLGSIGKKKPAAQPNAPPTVS